MSIIAKPLDPALFFSEAEWSDHVRRVAARQPVDWCPLTTPIRIPRQSDLLTAVLASLKGIPFRLRRLSGHVEVWRTSVGWVEKSKSTATHILEVRA